MGAKPGGAVGLQVSPIAQAYRWENPRGPELPRPIPDRDYMIIEAELNGGK
jgi:hypothetical protein